MTPELAFTEDCIAREVIEHVLDHGGSHVAYGRAHGYRVAGLAVQLDQHPSGVRRIPPPVVVAFHPEQWVRIMVMVQQMRRQP